MANKPDSFLGWLGRQVGFVNKAIKTDVTKNPTPTQQQACCTTCILGAGIPRCPSPQNPQIKPE